MEGRRLLAMVVLCCAVFTGLGFLLKAPCGPDYNGRRDRLLCSNDIQVLYATRGISQHTFPYVHGRLVRIGQGADLRDGAIEYPVLTGLAAWLPGLVSEDSAHYLSATAVMLAPFSLLTAWLLFRWVGRRAWYYAAAPPLIWYSFHNWDLLVVAATVAAFYLWWKHRPIAAALLLGVGGALKLWPLFFLAPLVLARLRDRDRAGAMEVAGAGVGIFALINSPFIVINRGGWWASYEFQGLRQADVTTNSIWYWGLPHLSRGTLNVLSPVLIATAFLVALGYGWVRARREDRYPFLGVCGAMLVAYLLLNKVHSPQYALWLLPFLVLLRVRWGWWAAYLTFDALLYVGLFRWFYDLSRGVDFGLPKQALILGVWGRAAMLVLLFVVFLRADAAVPEPESNEPGLEEEVASGPARRPSHRR
ncbi:MAG: glycosyltransferase 87 family protein [Pseudonocardiales bacterium]